MSKSKAIAAILLVVLSFLPIPSAAQGDVPLINYNEVYEHTFTKPNDQLFVQFEGNEGDLVYVLADYVDFVTGDIQIDLRDTVGRSVGFIEEYSFTPFVLAELPSTNAYTVVITAEEAETISLVVGLTGYLEDGVTFEMEEDEFHDWQEFRLRKVEVIGSLMSRLGI